MSTFNLPDSEVSVSLVDDLSQEELLKFPAFKARLSLPTHENANKPLRTGSEGYKVI